MRRQILLIPDWLEAKERNARCTLKVSIRLAAKELRSSYPIGEPDG